MKNLFKKHLSVYIFIILIMIFGCSTEENSSDSDLSGTIEIDGSSTVFPITVAAAEIFRESNPGVQIPVGISGTGGGSDITQEYMLHLDKVKGCSLMQSHLNGLEVVLML